jgi:hypothetical protein
MTLQRNPIEPCATIPPLHNSEGPFSPQLQLNRPSQRRFALCTLTAMAAFFTTPMIVPYYGTAAFATFLGELHHLAKRYTS